MGVPWVQIMENEFECLPDRGGYSGHFSEESVKNVLFLAQVIAVIASRFGYPYF